MTSATVRWTDPANTDFLGIVEWLQARDPQAAARVGRHILDTVEHLTEHPLLGKPGRVPDTRELGVPRYPYLIVYGVTFDQVAILRVLHGAMLWPSQE